MFAENQKLYVAKASGKREPFEPSKLRDSLKRAGAGEPEIETILKSTLAIFYDGISTKEIYQHAFQLLKKQARPAASRYKLKQAIMELGPSGYPFERFVGELLRHQGYQVQVGQHIQGYCVQHEVDVVAEKEQKHILVECKYHNRPGRISDVKVPLYIHSRFQDIRRRWESTHEEKARFDQGWIFTNTRFSQDAITYGNCVGLRLVSWDFPRQGSLKDLIDQAGLYPITVLSSLSRAEKAKLLVANIVLCRELLNSTILADTLQLSTRRHKAVITEIKDLLPTETLFLHE